MKLCLSIILLYVGTQALGRQIVVPDRCRPDLRRETFLLPPDCEYYKDLDCRRQADVAFILDASRSIGERAFGKEKQFFQKILEAFTVGPDFSKFAAITFSDKTELEFNLNDYNDRTSLVEAVNNIGYADGPSTLIYDALEYARENLFTIANGGRPGIQDVVILVTDGETQNPAMTKSEGLKRTQIQAQRLKEAGVFIVTIGVGPYINDNELRSIASSPEFYLKVDSYEELNEDAIVKQVTNLTCNELPPCPNKKLADYLQAHEGRVRRTSPIFPQSVKQVCEGIPVDLLFIVDQSTSLGEESFRKELNFINSIITNIDSNLLHVSVIKFSDEANIEIRFNQYQSMQDLTRAVSSIYYGGGNTYTNKALYLMLKEGFSDTNGARPGVDKIGIVITDGGSTDPISTKTMALKVQQEGIQMFAIGVGPEFASNERNNQEELNSIASDPDKDFVFTVDDADGLENIHNMISRKVCEDKCKDQPAPPCTDRPADIVFLLDDSTSLDSEANFKKELSFVSDLVASFNVGPNAQRVAAISFSTNAETEFHLDTYGSRTQVQNALAAIPYSTGDTNMHLAFEKMLNEEFSGARGARNVDKIAVVLTDGNPTDRYKLADQVKEAKARGITIFTVGIGPDVKVNRLNEIASEPSQYYSFSVSSLDTLSQIRRQMGLRICALNGPHK